MTDDHYRDVRFMTLLLLIVAAVSLWAGFVVQDMEEKIERLSTRVVELTEENISLKRELDVCSFSPSTDELIAFFGASIPWEAEEIIASNPAVQRVMEDTYGWYQTE